MCPGASSRSIWMCQSSHWAPNSDDYCENISIIQSLKIPQNALLMMYFSTVTKLFSLKYAWGKNRKSPCRCGVILAAAVSQNNLLILNLLNRGGAAQRRHKHPTTGCNRVNEKMAVRYLRCKCQSLIQAAFTRDIIGGWTSFTATSSQNKTKKRKQNEEIRDKEKEV